LSRSRQNICCNDVAQSPIWCHWTDGAFSFPLVPEPSTRTCRTAPGTGPGRPPIEVIRTRRWAGRLPISSWTCTGGHVSGPGRVRTTLDRIRRNCFSSRTRSPVRLAMIWSGSAASLCPRRSCPRRTARRRVPRTLPNQIWNITKRNAPINYRPAPYYLITKINPR